MPSFAPDLSEEIDKVIRDMNKKNPEFVLGFLKSGNGNINTANELIEFLKPNANRGLVYFMELLKHFLMKSYNTTKQECATINAEISGLRRQLQELEKTQKSKSIYLNNTSTEIKQLDNRLKAMPTKDLVKSIGGVPSTHFGNINKSTTIDNTSKPTSSTTVNKRVGNGVDHTTTSADISRQRSSDLDLLSGVATNMGVYEGILTKRGREDSSPDHDSSRDQQSVPKRSKAYATNSTTYDKTPCESYHPTLET